MVCRTFLTSSFPLFLWNSNCFSNSRCLFTSEFTAVFWLVDAAAGAYGRSARVTVGIGGSFSRHFAPSNCTSVCWHLSQKMHYAHWVLTSFTWTSLNEFWRHHLPGRAGASDFHRVVNGKYMTIVDVRGAVPASTRNLSRDPIPNVMWLRPPSATTSRRVHKHKAKTRQRGIGTD